jgi:mono/diheme cytochrome c family protein
VRAYLATLEAPAYPRSIDGGKADRGKTVFAAYCSRCHGTYGEGGSYPNYLVSIDEVQTDPWLVAGANNAERFRDWFSRSFGPGPSSITGRRTSRTPPGAS